MPTKNRRIVTPKVKLYAPEAEKRQREHGGTAPGKASKNTSGRSARSEEDRPRAKAAAAMNVSPRQVQKAESVVYMTIPGGAIMLSKPAIVTFSSGAYLLSFVREALTPVGKVPI
jgi:hypothetical protein